MSSIAWIQQPGRGHQATGHWGSPHELRLPSDARGVLLAEGVFETVLVLDGRPRLLGAHLARWRQGAELLALEPPPELSMVRALIDEAIVRSGIRQGALRLNWCRGSGPRGLEPIEPQQAAASNLFWLQLSDCTPDFAPVSVIVSPTEVRHATSVLSRCKHFGYGSALIARRQAREAGAGDALLLSSTGELCCGSSSSLLVRIDNHWHTPPLASGCLPGIMRQQALQQALAQERPLSEGDLECCEAALLLNSLSCRPIHQKGRAHGPGRSDAWSSDDARVFWQGLLND